MHPRTTLLALAILSAPLHAQIFQRNAVDVPDQGASGIRWTENVDFGDVDLDGDFDAMHARGGDLGNVQDRLWINTGGLQAGTVGVFTDETSARLPAIARDARDVELADVDGDMDLDAYVANDSSKTSQGSLWFINEGGLQGGTLGFYADESASRWIGIAGVGSSVSPAAVLPSGAFIDWSGDGEFGDLDNDGDLDLVHSSYGGNFSGNVPTRIFLNDGGGYFEEFNPSGFQLPGVNIADGDPGLWCEGTQMDRTTDATGAFCDVANTPLDVDLGDVDGDFDLDLLHGDLHEVPRFFQNRLQESGSGLAFRDVTGTAFPVPYTSMVGNYEQELGDFDGDQDLDVYGVDWMGGDFGIDDVTLENDGTGTFTAIDQIPASGSDDVEGDFGDYDNDGDLDVVLAGFAGHDRLYENTDGAGTYALVPTSASGLADSGLPFRIGLDVEWCDVDEDGDYDFFSASDANDPTLFWENRTGTPDTTAPLVGPIESLADAPAAVATAPDRPVRAHVYDNAPYYLTWYADVDVVVDVDGSRIGRFPARTMGGQLFRGEIPSNLVGAVEYRFEATDGQGNTGVSPSAAYVAGAGGLVNAATYGSGSSGGLGFVPGLSSKALLTPGKPWYVELDTGGSPHFYFLAVSLDTVTPAVPDPLLGFVNVDFGQIVLTRLGATDAAGKEVLGFPIEAGTTGVGSVALQLFVPDVGFTSFVTSPGLEVTFHE